MDSRSRRVAFLLAGGSLSAGSVTNRGNPIILLSRPTGPVDYVVWGALHEMVYHCKTFKSVQGKNLKSAIVTA